MTIRSKLGRLRFRAILAINSKKFLNVQLSTLEDCLKVYSLDGALKGKTVVDVGCDYGNSAIYWRLNGAAKVIGYEKDQRYLPALHRLAKQDWFDFRGEWKGELPDGDVLKIDCELCERRLDLRQLGRYGLWFVSLHELPEQGSTLALRTTLEQMGGQLGVVYNWHGGTELNYWGGRSSSGSATSSKTLGGAP